MEKYSKLIRSRIVITALVLIVFGMLTACTTDSQPEDDSTMNAEEIRSFAISVPGEVLTDLNDRLERTRLPDQRRPCAPRPLRLAPAPVRFMHGTRRG